MRGSARRFSRLQSTHKPSPSMRRLFVKSLPDVKCLGLFHYAQGKPPLSRRSGPAHQL